MPLKHCSVSSFPIEMETLALYRERKLLDNGDDERDEYFEASSPKFIFIIISFDLHFLLI